MANSEFSATVHAHTRHYTALLEREGLQLLHGGAAAIQIRSANILRYERRNFLRALATALDLQDAGLLLAIARHLRLILELTGEYEVLREQYSTILAAAVQTADSALETEARIGLARAALAVADGETAQAHAEIAAQLALARSDETNLVRSSICIGDCYYMWSRKELALGKYQETLAPSLRLRLYSEHCRALTKLAGVAQDMEDHCHALALLQECQVLAQRHGLLLEQSAAHTSIGNVQFEQGRLAEARQSFEQALELRRYLGDQAGVAKALRGLAGVEYFSGHLAAAGRLLEQALAIDGELGNRTGYCMTLTNLANVIGELGNHERAIGLFRESARLAGEIGDRHGQAIALMNVACQHIARGMPADAHLVLLDSLQLFSEIANPSGQVIACAWTAALLCLRGRPAQAAVLAAAAATQMPGMPSNHAHSTNDGLTRAKELLARSVAAGEMSADALVHQTAVGAALELQEAASYARRCLEELKPRPNAPDDLPRRRPL